MILFFLHGFSIPILQVSTSSVLSPLSVPASSAKIRRSAVSTAETEKNLFVSKSIDAILFQLSCRFRFALERHFAQMCDKSLAQKFDTWAESYLTALMSSSKAVFELIQVRIGVDMARAFSVCFAVIK